MCFITSSSATLTLCDILCEDEWGLLMSLWILQLPVFKFYLIMSYELEP